MNILTFDIEEWFHSDFFSDHSSWDNYEVRIYKNVERILTILEEKDVKATFFCLGWIASKHPDIVKTIYSGGHQIGCHSNTHNLVTQLTKEQFRSDTIDSLHRIEDIIGEKVSVYRAPAFSISNKTKWAFEILAENGIIVDCSIFPTSREYGGFPSFDGSEPILLEINGYLIKELPINIVRILGFEFVFSGGGYFRLFPYWAISRWMRRSEYNMTYFHPRDFDSDQPMLSNLPLHRKIKSYVGLKHSFSKFEQLLEEFSFINVEHACKMINWDSVNRVNLKMES